MPVVSDSSPLIALTQIDRLDLLRDLFFDVLIPTAVASEISPTLPQLPPWIRVSRDPPPALFKSDRIGAGEREVIALGLGGAEWVLLDEQAARRVARSLGLSVIGTVGVLLAAKRRGLISHVRPCLDALLKARFFLSTELYDRVIAQAGE